MFGSTEYFVKSYDHKRKYDSGAPAEGMEPIGKSSEKRQ